MENLVVIIPAAGAGKRMGLGYNKAFAPLRGVPVLARTLSMVAATGLCAHAIVVVAPGEEAEAQALLGQHCELYANLSLQVVAGGKERQDSVMNALAVVSKDADYIAVHDGARPFAGTEVFQRTLDAAKAHGAAIAAVPVKDTIKVVDASGAVVATPVRSTLVAVQTPQIFEAKLLKNAYARLQVESAAVTDDASVVELFGYGVMTALGRYENIKITTPEDLAFAERLLDEM